MLFESQSKADNFIKFNRDEIAEQSGKAPSRSYYCSFCFGWHITSIADSNKAVARDKRDAQIWEKIRQANASKKKKPKAETSPMPKAKKFPKSKHGDVLRIIAEDIDKTIILVESAFYNVDIHRIRIQLDKLLSLENDLRAKSTDYGIDISPIDKRYEKISQIKSVFSKIYDYYIDKGKRQFYLSALTEEDLTKCENIIINNIEIIDRINICFERIKLLSANIEQDEIRELCNDILTNLIPQLKGSTSQLKRNFRNDAEEILSSLSYPKQSIDNHYKNLILTIIDHLENAHKAYKANDFESCEAHLKLAEILLPDVSNDIEMTLYNQIENLRNLMR